MDRDNHTTGENTVYSKWTLVLPGHDYADYVKDAIANAGAATDDYDIDAIEDEYTAAINARLPEGVTHAGDIFYGPFPRPENAVEIIREAIEAVDLWEIVSRHDNTATS